MVSVWQLSESFCNHSWDYTHGAWGLVSKAAADLTFDLTPLQRGWVLLSGRGALLHMLRSYRRGSWGGGRQVDRQDTVTKHFSWVINKKNKVVKFLCLLLNMISFTWRTLLDITVILSFIKLTKIQQIPLKNSFLMMFTCWLMSTFTSVFVARFPDVLRHSYRMARESWLQSRYPS